MNPDALHLIVELRYEADQVDGAEERAIAFVERTRAEPGCEKAFFYRVNEDSERFVFQAEFRDLESLEEHLEAPWREEVLAELSEFLTEPPRRYTMQRVA